MAQQSTASRIITISGTGSIAALLFWMALYTIGPMILIVNVVALVPASALLTRHARHGWLLAERLLIACLVAAQAGLIVAMLIRLAPVAAKHIL